MQLLFLVKEQYSCLQNRWHPTPTNISAENSGHFHFYWLRGALLYLNIKSLQVLHCCVAQIKDFYKRNRNAKLFKQEWRDLCLSERIKAEERASLEPRKSISLNYRISVLSIKAITLELSSERTYNSRSPCGRRFPLMRSHRSHAIHPAQLETIDRSFSK